MTDGLIGNLKTSTDPITEYMTNCCNEEHKEYFSFREVSQVEVRGVVDLLKGSRAMDVYGLNSLLIKKLKISLFPV